MIETVGLLAVVGALVALLGAILLPILFVVGLVGFLARALIFLVALPFRIVGVAIGALLPIAGIALAAAALGVLVLAVLAVGLIPLLPIAAVLFVAWLLLRPARARSTA
jgi:hypothetical protein